MRKQEEKEIIKLSETSLGVNDIHFHNIFHFLVEIDDRNSPLQAQPDTFIHNRLYSLELSFYQLIFFIKSITFILLKISYKKATFMIVVIVLSGNQSSRLQETNTRNKYCEQLELRNQLG